MSRKIAKVVGCATGVLPMVWFSEWIAYSTLPKDEFSEELLQDLKKEITRW